MNDVEAELTTQLDTLQNLIDLLIEFAVAYGFQILGALVFLLIGLKIAGVLGRRLTRFADAKGLDPTLSKFIGSALQILLVVVLAIITLGNFGISIAPLIALAGASAFGATLALQGPLSNYGAGLSIILSRPFVVGDTIQVAGVAGVVEEVKLAATVLVGEDTERITVPNKEIVGQVIVNSRTRKIVEVALILPNDANLQAAADTARRVLAADPDIASEDGPAPQVGVEDFTLGGIKLVLRYWAPSQGYFPVRFRVNAAVVEALRAAGIRPLELPGNRGRPMPATGDDA